MKQEKEKLIKVTKHDHDEVMKFVAYVAHGDASADLLAVYRRLAAKYRMEYAS